MTPSPSVIVFDVNETLSDMAPMADRFAEIGAPAHLARTWFASVLRDGFALTAAGGRESFATIGAAALRTVLNGVALDRDLEDAVQHVISGMAQLPLHADVPDGVRALRAGGRRLVTLTNGSVKVSEKLLDGAGLAGEFERLLSVEDAGKWKPDEAAYAYAAQTCGVPLADMMLVAVHPWDIDGAARAGMATAWIDRTGTPYPEFFSTPTHVVSGVGELAEELKAA
jgi:2-haloacid dehalogenase